VVPAVDVRSVQELLLVPAVCANCKLFGIVLGETLATRSVEPDCICLLFA
jgi:hypothetical protein